MKWVPVDILISLTLLVAGFVAYLSTLAPTVLDGDSALYQFTPYVLGVTYPTGFPIYLLLGKLWLMLIPFGEIAWRMNLLSAVCGALTLPLLYHVAHRVWRNRWAALTSVLVYATLPTFWLWSTQAKTYTMTILLFVLALYLLVGLEADTATDFKGFKHLATNRSKLIAFVLGLQIGVHNTALLLLPGLLWLLWLNLKANSQDQPKMTGRWLLVHGLWLALPIAAYLYIPLRGEWLIAQYGRETAIAQGLLADFYQSGWQGWLSYFTAAAFASGVVANWGRLPLDFVTVYLPFLRDDFTMLGMGLGLVGALTLAWRNPRHFWPLLLIYLLPIPFVLTYGRGQQRAFLLTSNLVFTLFIGGSIKLLALMGNIIGQRWMNSVPQGLSMSHLSAAFGFVGLIALWPYQQMQANIEWLDHKWHTATYTYWADVLSHPLEPQAGIMATWGDLTSMWYMQLVEARRPDLQGLYPPQAERAVAWLDQGQALYVAGPTIASWDEATRSQFQWLAWGRLVRLVPHSGNLQALTPTLAQSYEAVFEHRLNLSSAEFPATVKTGGTLPTFFVWRPLARLSNQMRYSLRLVQGDGVFAQKDDTLLSGWFPLDYIPADQPLIGAYPLEIPLGTLPGSYQLQVAVYEQTNREWSLANGQPVLNLGQVTVEAAPPANTPGAMRFGDEIALDATDFSVTRVRQGKGFALRLLWQTLAQPQENYTLHVALVDASDALWRDWYVPVETTRWLPKQQIRQQLDLTIPAEAPTGEGALAVRLSWLTGAGHPLPVQRWILPVGDSFKLNGPRIMRKENRRWDRPQAQQAIAVNFANQAALIGYDLPATLLILSEANPILPLTLYWQGLGEMDQVYYTFIHLVNAEGVIVAQKDGVQAQGRQPTTSWAVGEYIVDPIEIALPANLPAGEYIVVTGLYLPPHGPRLSHLDEAGKRIGNAINLGTVQVVSP